MACQLARSASLARIFTQTLRCSFTMALFLLLDGDRRGLAPRQSLRQSNISRASTPSCCRVLSSSTARCFRRRDNSGSMWISMPFLPTREGRVAAAVVERLARSSAVIKIRFGH